MEKNLNQRVIELIDIYFKWIVMFAMILIFGLGYFFLIRPEMSATLQKESYQKIESEYLALKRFLTQLNELSGVYQQISANDIARVDRFLPDKMDVEELMRQMEVIVLQNGLSLSTLQISTGEEHSDGIGSVNIDMNVAGTDYNGFKNLLYTIESNLRLLDVMNLTFSPSAELTTINLVAYYKKK